MKYIHATKGAAISLVLFAVLAYFLPSGGESDQIELLLTISTFLFAILAGFYLSRLNTRYDKMRELIANEDALWTVIHELSLLLDKKYQESLITSLDKYFTMTFDYKIGDGHRSMQKHIDTIYRALRAVKPEGNFEVENAYDNSFDGLQEIEKTRNEISVIGVEKLSKGQWSVMIILSVIVLFSIFFLKDSDFFSQLMTTLLASVLILVLFLMRDLQNFLLGGAVMVEESSEEVFEAIGEMRYYPLQYLKQFNPQIPNDIEEIRVGFHDPYDPNKQIEDIRVVKVSDVANLIKMRNGG